MKPETRNPKPESSPNPQTRLEIRNIRHSDFRFDSSFGFRHSDFRARGSGFRSRGSDSRARGFTLVELMISLFMVLILILGINYVFRSATDAVGAGQTTNQINSDAQATQPVLFGDLRDVSKNPPAFIIASQLVTQYLNAQDANGGVDPNVISIDTAGKYAFIGINPNKPTYFTGGPQQWISPAFLNSRNHRCDLLKFFAHGFYQRRTGPDGTFLASDTSNDAFIEYGHAALPANDLSNFYGPTSLPPGNTGYAYTGDLQTPAVLTPGVPRTGAYAADWVLARRITLLKDPTQITAASGPYYKISGPTPAAANGRYGANMSPLCYGAADSANTTQFQTSRYDLAGVTPEQYDRVIANAILNWQANGYTADSLWWNPLVYAFGTSGAGATPPQYFTLPTNTPPYLVPYWNAAPQNAGLSQATLDPGLWYDRTRCNPAIQNPVTSASLAEMSSYFLQHCSQFIVEYAGDYIQQDNLVTDGQYSNMTGIGPDGQIDYYLDANGNKHIRWYGMPRSSTGVLHDDGLKGQVLIRGFDPTTDKTTTTPTSISGGPQPTTILLNYFTDVIPLRDYYSMWFATNPPTGGGATGAFAPPWEVDINFDPTHDYANATGNFPLNFAGPNRIEFNDPNNPPRYVAAWHDDMPAMVRILIKVDDPNNKVKDGPWYEYVFRLK